MLTQVERLQAMVSEPIHEYTLVADVIKKVLRYRSAKNIQLERTVSKHAHKREKLEHHLKADFDSQRLAQALDTSSIASQQTDNNEHGASVPTAANTTKHRNSLDTGNRPSEHRPTNRRLSASEPFSQNPLHADDNSHNDDFDDPLAKFQAEESAIWGGGAGSTIPRIFGNAAGASRRGPISPATFSDQDTSANNGEQRRNSVDINEPEPNTQDPRLVKSAYIERHDHRISFDSTISQDAASTTSQLAKSTGALPPPPSKSFGSRVLSSPKVLGSEIMNRLTYVLNGMMDTDPEQLRRNQIGKLTDRIAELEEQSEMLQDDLTLINSSVQDNLDRYQREKVRDIKNILLDMAKMHIEWCNEVSHLNNTIAVIYTKTTF